MRFRNENTLLRGALHRLPALPQSKEMKDDESLISTFGFPLSGRARLRVSGMDHLRYLNGQTTQDLKRADSRVAVPACVTSAKGRLQAEVWVVAEAGSPDSPALLVDAPGVLREALVARLERYVVADDVLVEDITGRDVLIHFPSSEIPLAPELQQFPAVGSARLGTAGRDVWLPAERFESVRLALGDRLGKPEDYERLRISRGVPAWGAELSEDTLPPEAGLERTHIDYHKGCYIGQEVISRLRSVGHVNRLLRRFKAGLDSEGERAVSCAVDGLPAVGTTLYVAGERTRPIGILTSLASAGDGGFYALGYLKRGGESSCIETAEGVRLAILPDFPPSPRTG